MFIEALLTRAKTWKHPKCPLTEEWVKKMQIPLHSGILLSQKKE